MSQTAVLASCVFILIALLFISTRKTRRSPLPPGPQPLPFIGNVFDVPQVKPWIKYHEWSVAFNSELIYLQLPKQPTVILDSAQAAFDLFEKRANIYSDRHMAVIDEITGWDWAFSLLPYGFRWRSTRRVFHQHFRQAAVVKYRPIQSREVHAFLRRALDFSGAINLKSVSQTFAAIVVDITYGIRISDPDDPYITLSHTAVEALSHGRMLGRLWAEYLPWLKYIPPWVPGSSATKLGAYYRPFVEAMRDRPFDAVKQDILAGKASPSVAQKLIESLDISYNTSKTSSYSQQEQTMREATGIAYAAAVDTQLSAISYFFLAMLLFPQVQERAQQEIARVVGADRLPTFEDLEAIPYIKAMLFETLRWQPTIPLGLPHRSMEDDEYNGYLIPRGTDLYPNVWAILHNPKDYPDPETFNPERYLKNGLIDPDVQDPVAIALGFGRRSLRKCPGKYLAADTLTFMMASVLHVYSVVPIIGDDGKPVHITTDATTGLFSYPENLPGVLKPRSASAVQLIASVNQAVEN